MKELAGEQANIYKLNNECVTTPVHALIEHFDRPQILHKPLVTVSNLRIAALLTRNNDRLLAQRGVYTVPLFAFSITCFVFRGSVHQYVIGNEHQNLRPSCTSPTPPFSLKTAK